MARKTKKTNLILPSNTRDAFYLKRITRRMLAKLEQIIDRLENMDGGNMGDIKNQYELLFGQKSSLVDALVILSDLLLKLSGEAKALSSDNKEDAWLDKLSESDIALVEGFISKLKSETSNQSPTT